MFNLIKTFIIFIIFLSNIYAQKQYYISLGDKPKYEKNFKHFDYVNPNAKKGGTFKGASIGTYDSLNPFLLKGNSARGIGLIYDTLMTSHAQEELIQYPLIAQALEISKNNDWVKFYLNKDAKFSDGKSIKAEDVKFSFEVLISKGSPSFKKYYSDIKNVKIIDSHTIKFNFKNNHNRELVSILGQLTILPKHFWKGKDFLKSDSIKPIGSGPYILDKYKFSKYISFKRNPNYWAKNLNVNKGKYNFDKIIYDYYKDSNVSLEAFKSGEYDLKVEGNIKNWISQYKGKNFDNNKIIKDNFSFGKAHGMSALVFNLRNPLFKNRDVRRAINLVFDFEWLNKKLFYNNYKRLNSFYDGSKFMAKGFPSKEELKILNPFKDQLPREVFEESFQNNKTKGDGNIREELRKALALLKKEGWEFKNKVLVKNGKKFEFEILLNSPSKERILNPFIKNLKKLGIQARLKIIDQVSFTNKIRNFDYDMTERFYFSSSSPGNELLNYWSSNSVNIKGSRNYIGVKSEIIDTLVNKIISSKDRTDLINKVKAFDRVLMHSYYLIPYWYTDSYKIAYWNKFNKPKNKLKNSFGLFTWWIKDEYMK